MRYVLEPGSEQWVVRDRATGKHVVIQRNSDAEMILLFRLWDDASLSLAKAVEKNQQILGRMFA